mgnify:CR=1 FL=1
MEMRLRPGLNGVSNELHRSKGGQQSNSNRNENAFKPGLNGGSNEAQRNQRCQQSSTIINGNAFETWAQRGNGWPQAKEARQSRRQSVRTTTQHQQQIEHEKMTKQK